MMWVLYGLTTTTLGDENIDEEELKYRWVWVFKMWSRKQGCSFCLTFLLKIFFSCASEGGGHSTLDVRMVAAINVPVYNLGSPQDPFNGSRMFFGLSLTPHLSGKVENLIKGDISTAHFCFFLSLGGSLKTLMIELVWKVPHRSEPICSGQFTLMLHLSSCQLSRSCHERCYLETAPQGRSW